MATGDLTNFWSDDHRVFGHTRLASRGEARWHEDVGDYPYVETTLDDGDYNVRWP